MDNVSGDLGIYIYFLKIQPTWSFSLNRMSLDERVK